MPIVDGKIKCSICGEWKLMGAYSPRTKTRGRGECRPCDNARQRTRRQRLGDAWRAAKREHYHRNKLTYRRYNLARYSITPEQYDRILAEQGGGCACCGGRENRTGKRLFVDHDHQTGAVRGILCHKCNAGIGALGDGVEGVRRALAYLERAQSVGRPSMRINLLPRGRSNVAA